ncbi:condensin complex subunit 2-like isoform X2 [Tripterygium wilfordii]|uniref:condensin complex subunit 2-like isoform X2 n=1 Tax=Tripterygium wilfordii TaxID=458696 RepID=UPI0018F7EA84|nr:condensin complex subunit 2-like isoform X2 [Tripterygium wilfordii]
MVFVSAASWEALLACTSFISPPSETLSPNPTIGQKQRLPMAARIQSPTSPFFLGSNDDHLERAQARAAREAAIRRKSLAVNAPQFRDPDPCLGKEQILDLLNNCIKLASENKINQKNTWELGLIDHLYEIIKVEEEGDVETNFQKASCTLEAGVKIYSLRVDSVHSEAYKVLGGINRAGLDNEQDANVEDANIECGQEEGQSRKEMDRKISPLSTLESSFEALNVKKFDVAFSVDPLYHQTTAQFDEGGAKGLLLNNLGVYAGCRVLFDSQEVPGKCSSRETRHENSDTIDLTFAGEYIEQMVLNMHTKNEISPTLMNIVNQFDEDNRRPQDTFSCRQQSTEEVDADHDSVAEFGGDAFENCGTWDFDHDDQTSIVNEEPNGAVAGFPSYDEENESLAFRNHDIDDRFEKVDGYLFLNLGFTSNQNSWAGPDYWKYRKAKGLEDHSTTENGPPATTKKPRNKKQSEPDIDFTKSLDDDFPDVFAPPKNPKSLLLPANRAPCNTRLPEDCHYQPEDLVKLFLLPNVMCLGKRVKKSSDELRQHFDDYGPMQSWDNESDHGGQFDDVNVHSDVEEPNTLVSQPRQVNKIEVQYDKTSKQVDVQALKETLWDHIQEYPQMTIEEQEERVSFKTLLESFPRDCRAAPTIKDISPHLCFICLLHLANEHGLSIHGCTSLDDLSINIPSTDYR